jgi:excisionase family DNA binding protein
MADVMAKLLSLEKVAELLGVSVFSIRRYVALGRIKAISIGARILVSELEVRRLQNDGLPVAPVGRPRKAEALVQQDSGSEAST